MTAAEVPAVSSAVPLLEAVDVSKRFDGILALIDVSLRVEEGAFVGLIGPNGAGKTTLFDCLTGKQRPTGGSVALAGRSILGLPVHRRAELGIARTFQRMELFSGMSVRDHLVVADRVRQGRHGVVRDLLARSRSGEERQRVDEVLDLLGLARDAERPIEALSLGRGRLVELGRALVARPRILFLDEPSSGLDRQERREVGDVMLEVQRTSGVAVVLVEHDIPMVQRLARSLYVLDAGRVIASGDVGAVLDDPGVRAAYLGVEA